MKTFKEMSYTRKILWRNRLLRLLLICMTVYVVIASVQGGWDSRMMSEWAIRFSSMTYFGGLIFILYRISRNKKLLQSRWLLKEQLQKEQDEWNQHLHDKSGGTVLDILLVILLCTTLVVSAFDTAAFYTAFCVLVIAVVLKAVAYFIVSHEWQG